MGSVPNYTVVVGVDAKHLRQLSWTLPTWQKHKKETMRHPMLVFYDREQVTEFEIRTTIQHSDLTMVPWPPEGVTYPEGDGERWSNPQRHKMLAGFVHIAARNISTSYWLKLDTDCVATGMDDWIDEKWFVGDPAIVCHRWTFTRPANQMLKLDWWVSEHSDMLPRLAACQPLDLVPQPGSDRVGHRRIISWCGFFHTGFTLDCAKMAERTCSPFQLPVPSHDGYLFYCAKRLGLGIVRPNMKSRGFSQWLTSNNIVKAVKAAMEDK